MGENNYLGNAIDVAGDKAQYDDSARMLLSDKNVLSWILKYTADEFSDYDIPTIFKCIEGNPEVKIVPFMPGNESKEHTPQAIEGMPQEDRVPNEGVIYYDIRFRAVSPESKPVEIIIDVEAQKKFRQTYDIPTRGIIYASRMLSGQLGRNIVNSRYENAKKVYSIWLCFDEVPIELQNSITEYCIMPKCIYGGMPVDVRYDLLSVVTVCFGPNAYEEGNPLHRMLSVLMANDMPAQEKKKRMEQEFNIPVTETMSEEMSKMCNLSDLVEEKGIEKGAKQTVLSLLRKERLTLEEAAEELSCSVPEIIEMMKEAGIPVLV